MEGGRNQRCVVRRLHYRHGNKTQQHPSRCCIFTHRILAHFCLTPLRQVFTCVTPMRDTACIWLCICVRVYVSVCVHVRVCIV